MAIDNSPLTGVVVEQFLSAWGDFMALLNSDTAMLFFGAGGVLMGVTAQYNSRLSSAINKFMLSLYQAGKWIIALIVVIGIGALIFYVQGDNEQSQTLYNEIKTYPAMVYGFIVSLALLTTGMLVMQLNQPYPDLKNNVTGLGILFGTIYFLVEVQGVEVIEPPLVIVAVLAISAFIYLLGDFNMDKRVYLEKELKKLEQKQKRIRDHMAELEKEKRKKRFSRKRTRTPDPRACKHSYMDDDNHSSDVSAHREQDELRDEYREKETCN